MEREMTTLKSTTKEKTHGNYHRITEKLRLEAMKSHYIQKIEFFNSKTKKKEIREIEHSKSKKKEEETVA